MNKRISFFVICYDDSSDLEFVKAWISKWKGSLEIIKHFKSDTQHSWDLNAPVEAIRELPDSWLF